MKLIIIILLSLFFQNLLFARTNILKNISYNFEYLSTIESTNITNLTDNYFCCPNTMDGNGNVMNLGLAYNFRNIFDVENLEFAIGLNYSNYKSLIFYDEQEEINVNGEPFIGVIRHSVDFKSNSISPLIGLEYSYYSIFIKYKFGLNFFLDNNFTQKEEIILPTDRGVFQDTQTRIRKVINSNINNLSTPFTNQLTLGLALRFRSGLGINPGFTIGQRSSLTNDFDWTNYFYGFSIEVKFY